MWLDSFIKGCQIYNFKQYQYVLLIGRMEMKYGKRVCRKDTQD